MITRDDAMLLFGGRDLWPFGSISASANATASRSAVNVLTFDGTVNNGAVTGNNLTVQLISSVGVLDNYYDSNGSCLSFSKPWTIYLALSVFPVTNTELVFAIGALASSGVPSSGTSAGFRVSSASLASVWRCTTGTVVESTPTAISASASTAYAASAKKHVWLRHDGSGNLSLYMTSSTSNLRAAKPDFSTATLIGTVAGAASPTTGGLSLSLRATGTTSAAAGLFYYAASFTEI
jgi:hypothetical protein